MLFWIVGKHGLLAQSFRRIFAQKKLPFIATARDEVDITDRASIDLFLKNTPVTLIINCAAYTAVDNAEDEEEKAFLLNVIGPANLASFHLPIVHFSTDYVFDGKERLFYTELSKANPLNIYGKTKWEGEKAVLKNKQAIVLRISWLFGKEGTDFVRTMRGLFQARKMVQVVHDQKGRPTFADDVVAAALQLIEKKAFGLFHFANEGSVSWYEFAQEIHRVLGASCELVPVETTTFNPKARRPLNSILSTEKIEKFLGEKPPLWQNRLREVL